MKSNDKNRSQLLRIMGSGAGVFGLLNALVLGGCGGGGSDNGGAASGQKPSAISAYNFNADNTVAAARSAASAVAFFPQFTAVSRHVLATLAASDPANSPFDLAMCTNGGRSMLTWIDGDHSGGISMGDSASLQFTTCDMDGSGTTVSGFIKLGVTSVNPDPLPNSISLNASVNLTATGAADSTVFIANFGASSSTQNNLDFTNIYKSNGSSGQKLAVTKNGSSLFQLACFNVTQTFSVADGAGAYTLSPSGVLNISNAFMSLEGGSQLSFVSNSMESGTQRLLSLSAPECAALGASDSIGGSDGSYIEMEALGGGTMRLHTFDAANAEVAAMDTSWDALLK